MSRLIDADKFSAISYIEKSKDFTEGVEFVINMIDNAPTVQAIPIPDNATNGDVIQAVFPDIEISDGKGLSKVYTGIPYGELIGANIDCMRDWWNKPYKRSDAE